MGSFITSSIGTMLADRCIRGHKLTELLSVSQNYCPDYPHFEQEGGMVDFSSAVY
jgi:hypothetical protein